MSSKILFIGIPVFILSLFMIFQGNYETLNNEHLIYIVLIIVIGLFPTAIFLLVRAESDLIPLMPLHGMFYIFSLGIVALSDKMKWIIYDPIIIKDGLILAVLGLVFLNLGYYLSLRIISNRRRSIRFLDDLSVKRQMLIGWTLYIIYLLFIIFPSLSSINTVKHFPSVAMYISLGMLFQLTIKFPSLKVNTFLFILALTFILIKEILGGALIVPVMVGVFLAVIYWKLKGSIPWGFGLLIFLFVIVINPVKHSYRSLEAYGGIAFKEMSFGKKFSMYSDSFGDFFNNDKGVLTTINNDVSTVNRIANIPKLVDVVQRTPDEVPYWMGETYLPIFTFFIPRIIWPNKPVEKIGQEFGHRYGYLDENDRTTSMNLPWIIEMYANFGKNGIILGMFFIGVLFRFLVQKLSVSTNNGVEYIVGASVVIQLFFASSNFSLMTGGVFMKYIFSLLLLRILTLRFKI